MTTTSPFHPYDNITDWSAARSLERAAAVIAWNDANDIRAYLTEHLPLSAEICNQHGDEYPCALGVAQAVIGELVEIIKRQAYELGEWQSGERIAHPEWADHA